MRYVVNRMDIPVHIDEANRRADGERLYEQAVKDMPGASIRLLDRRGFTVLMQNYGEDHGR